MCDSKSLFYTTTSVCVCAHTNTYDILSMRHLNNIQNRQSNFLELYNKLELAECVFTPFILVRSGSVMEQNKLN